MLPYPVDYRPYTAAHVLTQVQLLLFSGLAFFVMLGYLKRTRTITLDVDWTWRVALPAVVRVAGSMITAVMQSFAGWMASNVQRMSIAVDRERRPDGLFVRTTPTTSMALWVVAMLLGYLVLYYLR
jgi:multicomponent Na+:H+ antiporter subunit D